MNIKDHIRTVPNWPTAPVRFRDVSSLLKNQEAFKHAMDLFIEHYRNVPIDVVAGLDARGFIPASVLAYALNKPLIMVRKKGKLPGETINASYKLEYGQAALEIQTSAAPKDARVLLMDDLIATGGTLCAVVQLFSQLGCSVRHVGAIVNLPELNGSKRLTRLGVDVFSLCEFTEEE